MMFSFIAKHRGIWPVALICEALGRCTGAEPQMAGRLHLRLDIRGLTLRGGRARPFLAPYRRLVDTCGDEGGARH
jgi:hypothetical protein